MTLRRGDNFVADLRCREVLDDDIWLDGCVNGVDDDKLRSHVARQHGDLMGLPQSAIASDRVSGYFRRPMPTTIDCFARAEGVRLDRRGVADRLSIGIDDGGRIYRGLQLHAEARTMNDDVRGGSCLSQPFRVWWSRRRSLNRVKPSSASPNAYGSTCEMVDVAELLLAAMEVQCN